MNGEFVSKHLRVVSPQFRVFMKQLTHSFCIKLLPATITAYGVSLGIAAAGMASNKIAKDYFDRQMLMLRDAYNSSYFLWVVILLFALWLCAFIWSAERKVEFETIEKKLTEGLRTPPPPVVIQPDDCVHGHTSDPVGSGAFDITGLRLP